MIKRVKKEEKVEHDEQVETKAEPLSKHEINEQWIDIQCAEIYGVTPGDI